MKVKIDTYTNIDELIEAAWTDEQRREAVKGAVTFAIEIIRNKHPMPLTKPLYEAVLGLLRSYQERDEKLHYVGDLPKLERLDAVEVVECSTIPRIKAALLADKVSQCSVNENVFSLIEDFFKSVAGSIEVKERPTEENGFKLILRRNTADFEKLFHGIIYFNSYDYYFPPHDAQTKKEIIKEYLHKFRENPPSRLFAPQYEIDDAIREKLTFLSNHLSKKCEDVDLPLITDCVETADFNPLLNKLNNQKMLVRYAIFYIYRNIQKYNKDWFASSAASIGLNAKSLYPEQKKGSEYYNFENVVNDRLKYQKQSTPK